MPAGSPLREALLVFVGVTAASVAISLAGRLPALSEFVHLAVGVVFLFTAVHMAGRSPGGLRAHGLGLGGLLEPQERPPGPFGGVKDDAAALARATPAALRELLWALALSALIFPPFAVGFWFWNDPPHPFELAWPPEVPGYLLTQILVVALPEEAFFRGYLQGRLGAALPGRMRLLGAQLPVSAVLLTSVLFGVIHFAVELHPARLAVFFPSLLFGWVRELRGGIGAAVFLHALSNLLSEVLARSWM